MRTGLACLCAVALTGCPPPIICGGATTCLASCSPSTCAGCCDGNDTCVTETTSDACGSFGSVCESCGSNACIAGTCALGDAGPGPDGGYVAPPTRAACAAPADAGEVLWTFDAGDEASSVALAWGGTEAGLAVIHGTTTSATATLQRISGDGGLLGSADLGPGQLGGVVSVATDGAGYVACWELPAGAGVGCGRVPVGSGAATPGLTLSGASPSMAFGPAGFVLLVWNGSSGELQPLDATGNSLDGGAINSVTTAGPAVVASLSGGYAVGVLADDGQVQVDIFDQSLTWQFSGTFPGTGSATGLQMAASGTTSAQVWVDSSSGDVFVATMDATGAGSGPTRVGTDTSAGRVAIAGAEGSFAATFSAFTSAQIDYAAVTLQAGPVGPATPLGSPLWDDSANAIVGVSDGFLAAYTLGAGGTAVVVQHLVCP
jgi:hypothetical protein